MCTYCTSPLHSPAKQGAVIFRRGFRRFLSKKQDYTKILNYSILKANGVKKRTDVEKFEEIALTTVENCVFLTFSTDFSTKKYGTLRVFNCPKKFLLPFCNLRLQPRYVEKCFVFSVGTPPSFASFFLFLLTSCFFFFLPLTSSLLPLKGKKTVVNNSLSP